jgi:hypothetical protein
MNVRTGLAALLLAWPAGTAIAADQPASLPTRDVDVAYRSQPAGPAGPAIEQRSRFSAAEQRTRLDMPTPGLFSIMDYRSRTMAIVSEPDHRVLETTGTQPPAPVVYERRGDDQVAGLPCTEWEARDSVGQPALTCFTADGVLLRVRRGTVVLAVATRVTYVAQPAELFQVPADYSRVTRSAARP